MWQQVFFQENLAKSLEDWNKSVKLVCCLIDFQLFSEMSMIQYTSDYDDFYIASLTDAMEQYAAAEFIITEIRQYLNTKNIPYITENSY